MCTNTARTDSASNTRLETPFNKGNILNPGQTPVSAADQPIYSVAKQIQWHWLDQYGEEKLVMMFGGLHIEMAAPKSIGTLLRDSGWTGADGSRDSFYGDG